MTGVKCADCTDGVQRELGRATSKGFRRALLESSGTHLTLCWRNAGGAHAMGGWHWWRDGREHVVLWVEDGLRWIELGVRW